MIELVIKFRYGQIKSFHQFHSGKKNFSHLSIKSWIFEVLTLYFLDILFSFYVSFSAAYTYTDSYRRILFSRISFLSLLQLPLIFQGIISICLSTEGIITSSILFIGYSILLWRIRPTLIPPLAFS